MKSTAVVCIGLMVMLGSACATSQGRSVNKSGFLGDYAQLQEGTGDQALLVYVKPNVEWRQYYKIVMDPIRVYADQDSRLGKIPPEDMKKLLDYLDAVTRENLRGKFEFVDKPGPGTIRLRIAITDAQGSKIVCDTLSSVLPPGIALSTLKSLATGQGIGIGAASAEFEIQDSLTGERLAAAVDRRVGNKYTFQLNKFSKWRAPKAAFDYWAERLAERADELQKTKAIE